jgi:ABC-type polysaccharide/polyol phosphate transport system ATPase subunit
MQKLLKDGRTVIMVSHGLDSLKSNVERILVLSKGRLIFDGTPKEAIKVYLDENYESALDGKRL